MYVIWLHYIDPPPSPPKVSRITWTIPLDTFYTTLIFLYLAFLTLSNVCFINDNWKREKGQRVKRPSNKLQFWQQYRQQNPLKTKTKFHNNWSKQKSTRISRWKVKQKLPVFRCNQFCGAWGKWKLQMTLQSLKSLTRWNTRKLPWC